MHSRCIVRKHTIRYGERTHSTCSTVSPAVRLASDAVRRAYCPEYPAHTPRVGPSIRHLTEGILRNHFANTVVYRIVISSSDKQTRAGTISTPTPRLKVVRGINKKARTPWDLRRALYQPRSGLLYQPYYCAHRTVQYLIRAAVRTQYPVLCCIIRGVLSMQGVTIPSLSPQLHTHVSFCAARESSRPCLRVPTQDRPSRLRAASTPCSGEPYSLGQRIMLAQFRTILSTEEPESKSWEPS